MMLRAVTCILAIFVAGCSGATAPRDAVHQEVVNNAEELLSDKLFRSIEVEPAVSADNFLALPPKYREQLDASVLVHEKEADRYEALRVWAFEDVQQQLEYDPAFTSPLAELEKNGRINCFSFSNLFVAAARYAGIDAHFQLVDSPPSWDMSRDTFLVSQHINVTGRAQRPLTDRERIALGDGLLETGTRIQRRVQNILERRYVADLNPEIAVDSYRARIISDQQALSLFYSNRSVEALVSGNLDRAFAFGREAVLADEESSTAWNNLGVMFSRAGKLAQAREAYETALLLDPVSESPASNLERIYRRLGDTARADAMARRIATTREKNPYYHYAIGEALLGKGEFEQASDHFEAAIDRKDDERLFYYALAEAQIRLGEYRRANRSLEVAKKYSTAGDIWRYEALHSALQSAGGDG